MSGPTLVTTRDPDALMAPETVNMSLVFWLSCIRTVPFKVAVLLTVKVPMGSPGDRVAPAVMVNGDAILPLPPNTPLLTTVEPLYVLVPSNSNEPLPTLTIETLSNPSTILTENTVLLPFAPML